jgi:hypothetical protein
MSWIPVDNYCLQYNTKEKTARIGIKYCGGSQEHSVTLPASDAIFLADLLRYERPVYFDPDSGAIVTTKGEEVGEQET